MTSQINRRVRLKSRPNGIPQADHFEIVAAALPEIAERQIMVRNEYLSVDPAMRGWVAAAPNYSAPVGIGEVMRAFSAGTVVASHHPNFREGDAVMGMLGWQEGLVAGI
jgi:NADPH-dependent curcumin reductase